VVSVPLLAGDQLHPGRGARPVPGHPRRSPALLFVPGRHRHPGTHQHHPVRPQPGNPDHDLLPPWLDTAAVTQRLQRLGRRGEPDGAPTSATTTPWPLSAPTPTTPPSTTPPPGWCRRNFSPKQPSAAAPAPNATTAHQSAISSLPCGFAHRFDGGALRRPAGVAHAARRSKGRSPP
jgi:hypothetical protein